jgi:branched-chain amino acid transport system substrate-binding protein
MGRIFRRLLAATALVLLAGCGGKTEPAPLWIGHISPRTGPDKAVGENARRGIQLAVEEANKNPEERGAGRPVRVRHTDSRGEPDAFGAEATRLVRVNRVVGLLGGNRTADIKEFRRLEGTGVCLVSPLGSVAGPPREGNVFFTGLSPGQKGRALARFAADKGFHHVVVLVDDRDKDGQYAVLVEAFREIAAELAGKKSSRRKMLLTGTWHYSSEAGLKKRARQLARELQKTGRTNRPRPDALLLAGKPAAVVQLREELGGTHLPILFGGGEGSTEALLGEPESRDRIYLATAFVPDAGTDRAAAFVKSFKKQFGEEPDIHAALAYDSARILFTALRKAENLDPGEIRKALAGLKDFPGLTGPLSFDSHGQAERPVFIVMLEQGKVVKVKRYSP